MTAPPRRVLVVDDEPEVAEILRDFLASDGYDAYVALNGPDALVIMMTANADEMTARETLKTGAFDYVAKPFEFAHLSRVVTAAAALGSDAPAPEAE